MAKIRMPADLKESGQELWKWIIDRDPPYELRPDEMFILIQCCHEADIIHRLELALAEDIERELQNEPSKGAAAGMTVKGSMGQFVVNPMIPELRQHRATQMALLKSLKLPDAKPESHTQRTDPRLSETRRAAARERWKTAKEA